MCIVLVSELDDVAAAAKSNRRERIALRVDKDSSELLFGRRGRRLIDDLGKRLL